jgi:hypothetical protein
VEWYIASQNFGQSTAVRSDSAERTHSTEMSEPERRTRNFSREKQHEQCGRWAVDCGPHHQFHQAAEDMLERTMRMTGGARKLDKLSNLTRRLETIERNHANAAGGSLVQARSAVVNLVSKYCDSRFHLGRVLRNYKMHFKAQRGWIAAAEAIAEAINRDERTVYRIIEDYERASRLPSIVLKAMEAQKIDPAAPKNAGMIQKLAQMPEPATRKKAELVVAQVRREDAVEKKAVRAAKLHDNEDIETFAARMLRYFEGRFGTVSPQQRDYELRFVLELIVNSLRADIRELRQFGRPTLVPKPASREVA